MVKLLLPGKVQLSEKMAPVEGDEISSHDEKNISKICFSQMNLKINFEIFL